MPVSPTYPGVYVQEVPSGVRTIVGVSTSITLFVGRAASGPVGEPVRCLTYTDFVRTFSEDPTFGDLPRHVKLFFLNGGSDCYVMRVAKNAVASQVTLKNENGDKVLTLAAQNKGAGGDAIRAIVSYDGLYPEIGFNLEVFRWQVDSAGNRTKADREVWTNLSMDPASAAFAPTILNQKSNLVSATVHAAAPGAKNGWSLAGRPVEYQKADGAAFLAAWQAVLNEGKRFRISVDSLPWVEVDLSPINFAALDGSSLANAQATFGTAIKQRIDAALPPGSPTVDVDFPPGPAAPAAANDTAFLRVKSKGSKDILVDRAANQDLAGPLLFGQGNGGIEVGSNAHRRPAPAGLSFTMIDWSDTSAPFTAKTPLNVLGSMNPGTPDLNAITLDKRQPDGTYAAAALGGIPQPAGVTRVYQQPGGGFGGIRDFLGAVRDRVNQETQADPTFEWKADLAGARLTITGTRDENRLPVSFKTAPVNLVAPAVPGDPPRFTQNVATASLGLGGVAGLQSDGLAGSDGVKPTTVEYDAAYLVIDREVDLFNLMVLPPDAEMTEAEKVQLWPNASVFCQKRRAFLILDPNDSWDDYNKANNGMTGLRAGLVKDYSAIYFPRLTVPEAGRDVTVTPAGAMAGLMARMDASRGVWKAPAGLEADVRGVTGLDLRLSDAENGVLNPNGVNAIRIFPDGIITWGSRTMAGADAFASEYKYIPIRRLALFLEESLYRGLKWVVFEPNDVALWSQIRLNVGAFMNDLFRKGAFQGTKPSDAYFVKCDAETTTQNDRDLGIVNIWVGFAPLKPAEFVILYLQQIAGQVQT
jgi:phage tail sheath protein FI